MEVPRTLTTPIAITYSAPFHRTALRHAYNIGTGARTALQAPTTARLTMTDTVRLQGVVALDCAPPHPVAVRSTTAAHLLATAIGGRRSTAVSPARIGICVSDTDELADELALSDYLTTLDTEADDVAATWDVLDLAEPVAYADDYADDYASLAYGANAADMEYAA